MIFKKLDTKLREVWSFWDTHGGRILGVLSTLYSFSGSILVALLSPSSRVSAAIMAGAGALGLMVRGRSANNAEILAAKNPPAP